MPVYKAPVEDVMFLLNDVFPIERYLRSERQLLFLFRPHFILMSARPRSGGHP